MDHRVRHLDPRREAVARNPPRRPFGNRQQTPAETRIAFIELQRHCQLTNESGHHRLHLSRILDPDNQTKQAENLFGQLVVAEEVGGYDL